MKKPLIVAAIIVVLVAIAMLLAGNRAEAPSDTEQPTTQGKINIVEVCNGALAYMSFMNGEDAEVFVQECIEGKHPEVIDRYIADMNLDGAAI